MAPDFFFSIFHSTPPLLIIHPKSDIECHFYFIYAKIIYVRGEFKITWQFFPFQIFIQIDWAFNILCWGAGFLLLDQELRHGRGAIQR